jgi:hypothetical protein
MIKASFSFNKLPITITKQGKRLVAYSPALDLSTSGKSIKDVQKKFSELVFIFLEEIIEAGTVNEVLSELGWKKVQQKWNPPQVISSKSIGVRLPVFA